MGENELRDRNDHAIETAKQSACHVARSAWRTAQVVLLLELIIILVVSTFFG